MKRITTALALLSLIIVVLASVGCGSGPALDDKQGTGYNSALPLKQKTALEQRKEKADNLTR